MMSILSVSFIAFLFLVCAGCCAFFEESLPFPCGMGACHIVTPCDAALKGEEDSPAQSLVPREGWGPVLRDVSEGRRSQRNTWRCRMEWRRLHWMDMVAAGRRARASSKLPTRH
ncbi:hypothetical protein BV25DRAFT_272671 [Artomyces pyxidatus]|uniref:Uncharacterized protein n=1 Tax=Artomyces pyxidatus TaxID=48021 RepID=A0ACB8T6Y7_9AGAM|nr:hypothetical protein BV25DRAFT_272671 [Artomyces pyxidatus]